MIMTSHDCDETFPLSEIFCLRHYRQS